MPSHHSQYRLVYTGIMVYVRSAVNPEAIFFSACTVLSHTNTTSTFSVFINGSRCFCLFAAAKFFRFWQSFAGFLTSLFASEVIMSYSIQILTAFRGTVKIIGPRWCQNHDYARGLCPKQSWGHSHGFDITKGL